MSERTKATTKASETKSNSPVSKSQKINVSPSINSHVDQILFLQRTIGDQAVQRLFKSGVIQAKLKIGQSNDIYEQEADRVAEQVMRMPENTAISGHPSTVIKEDESVQRKPSCAKGSCEEEEVIQPKPLVLGITPLVQRQVEEEFLQTKEAGLTPEVAPNIESQINSLKGSGQPLPAPVRAFFEPRFGYGFSQVRIHNSAQATETTKAVNARAFTVGRDMVFGAGQYAPGTSEGRRLIAHELTHVVQQQFGGKTSLISNLQLKERTEWRTHYKTKKEAEIQRDYLRRLGLEVDEPIKQKNLWTFYYYPLTKDEAEAEKKKKEIELGEKYILIVEFDKKARSFFVKKVIKCPEAIPTKTGYKIWDKCFTKKPEAENLRKKFETAFLEAEVYELDKSHFGVYYKPMTKEEAEKAGKSVAEKRPGFAEGMFTVKVSENKELKSFTYRIETTCPKGYDDLGNFQVTAYVLAQEKEFPEKPQVKDPCGLKGTFRHAFLFQTNRHPRGVMMQGSGRALSGDIIHYNTNKKCFEIAECPPTASGKCAKAGRTVAADPEIIPIKKEKKLLIEDVGTRVAEDTGGRIKGKHIDIYYGLELTMDEALKKSMTKKVCMEK